MEGAPPRPDARARSNEDVETGAHARTGSILDHRPFVLNDALHARGTRTIPKPIPKRSPNNPRTIPKRSPNDLRTITERSPNNPSSIKRPHPERSPNDPQTIPERSPNDPQTISQAPPSPTDFDGTLPGGALRVLTVYLRL